MDWGTSSKPQEHPEDAQRWRGPSPGAAVHQSGLPGQIPILVSGPPPVLLAGDTTSSSSGRRLHSSMSSFFFMHLRLGDDTRRRQHWDRRFFVLTGTTLYYFRRKPDAELFGELRCRLSLMCTVFVLPSDRTSVAQIARHHASTPEFYLHLLPTFEPVDQNHANLRISAAGSMG